MGRVTLLGVHPNLVLLFATIWVLQRGLSEGLSAGVLGGLVLDVSSAAPFGMAIAAIAATACLAAVGRTNVFRGAWYLRFGVVAAATLLFNVLCIVILRVSGVGIPLLTAGGRIVFPEVVIHMAITPLAFWLVKLACSRLEPATVEI